MGIANIEQYEITSQDLIFRGIYHSAISDDKIYSPRLVKYINEAFFVWGECDASIKKLLKNKKGNEQKLIKLINELVRKTVAYKSSLFEHPENAHIPTARLLDKPALALYNKRHNKNKETLHAIENAPFGLIPDTLHNVLYDCETFIIDRKALKVFNLTPPLLRIGEIFLNLDQLYMCLSDTHTRPTLYIDSLNTAVYDYFMYIGELANIIQTSLSNVEGASNTINKKRKLIKNVKDLYDDLCKDEPELKYPKSKAEEEIIISKLTQMYKEKYPREKPLNKCRRWYTENIF